MVVTDHKILCAGGRLGVESGGAISLIILYSASGKAG